MYVCKHTLEKLIQNFSNFDNQIIEEVQTKNLEATLLFVDSSKTFDATHKRKMEQIPLTYGSLKEIINIIMMFSKNMKAMVHLPAEGTDFFTIVNEVLLGNTLTPFLLIICLIYSMKLYESNEKNCFTHKKEDKKKIYCRKYYRCRLCSWSSASYKYTCWSWIYWIKQQEGLVFMLTRIIPSPSGLIKMLPSTH